MQDLNALQKRMQGATTYLELATVKEAFERFVEAQRREKAHVELTLAGEEGARYTRVQRTALGDGTDQIAVMLEGTTFVLTLRMGTATAQTLVELLRAAVSGVADDAVHGTRNEATAAAAVGDGEYRHEQDTASPQ